MVIKSTSEESMLRDIQETFDRLRFVNMKLNLKKCSFGVEEGPFLGHLITKQGIRANPSKVKAVTNLEPPRTLKDVQSLNEKLAVLRQFLSKGVEKSFPFFKTLMSCTDKKTIQWTEDAERALRRMKELKEILPTLTVLIKGEVLVMYLAVSIESISVTLLARRENRQVPIYFVSRVLQGAELNYPELEKLILALAHVEQFLSDHYITHVTPPAYTPPPPFLATIEPLDTLLMGDMVISTTHTKENDEFIKSSVDDFVPIPKVTVVTSVSIDLECGMPIDTTPSPYLVVLGDEKINLILRDDLNTLLTGDREIDFNPSRDIEELECLLANDPVPVPRVFDEPLGNTDSMSRSIETSDLILEELTTEIGLNDSIPTEIDDGYYDSEGDILYFEQLLNEDTSSDLSPAVLPSESSLLVPPLPNIKQTCLREVEIFNPFFSLT
ncbi:reverse transcriptase domain-containing protein [Tanacetum coccineum]